MTIATGTEGAGEASRPHRIVGNRADALEFGRENGFPVIVRPSFSMGGKGGGVAGNADALDALAERGIRLSPIGTVMVECGKYLREGART